MGREGATKWEGGACEVLPYEKGAEKILAMLKGGGEGTTNFWVVFTQ